jgi:hypothetical protein
VARRCSSRRAGDTACGRVWLAVGRASRRASLPRNVELALDFEGASRHLGPWACSAIFYCPPGRAPVFQGASRRIQEGCRYAFPGPGPLSGLVACFGSWNTRPRWIGCLSSSPNSKRFVICWTPGSSYLVDFQFSKPGTDLTESDLYFAGRLPSLLFQSPPAKRGSAANAASLRFAFVPF